MWTWEDATMCPTSEWGNATPPPHDRQLLATHPPCDGNVLCWSPCSTVVVCFKIWMWIKTFFTVRKALAIPISEPDLFLFLVHTARMWLNDKLTIMVQLVAVLHLDWEHVSSLWCKVEFWGGHIGYSIWYAPWSSVILGRCSRHSRVFQSIWNALECSEHLPSFTDAYMLLFVIY